MTKRDDTYQNARINLIQGGQILSIDSDGYFDFYGQDTVTGVELRGPLLNAARMSRIGQSTDSTKFSQTNIPNSAKYVIFSMTSNLATGSAWLCSGPIAGQEMYILVTRGSCASGLVLISTSGVSLVGLMGSAISIIRLYNSAASCGACHLVCRTDGEWAVAALFSHGVAFPSAVPD